MLVSDGWHDGTIIHAPSPRDLFADDDEVLLMGHESALPSLTLAFPAGPGALSYRYRGTTRIA